MSYWSVVDASFRDDTDALTGSGISLRPWLTDAGEFDGSTATFYPSQAVLAVGNQFTVAFWLRTASLVGQQVLIESGGYVYGWSVLLSDSMLHFVWSNSYNGQVVSHDLVGRENDSVHVTVRVDGQQMTLLVDGQQVATIAHPTLFSTAGNNSGSIGGSESDYRDHLGVEHSGGPGHYFTGQIDQLLTFDTALSNAYVSELFLGPEPTNTTSPTATFNGRIVAWTAGAWDAYGNGAIALLGDVYLDSLLIAADQVTDTVSGGEFHTGGLGVGLYEVAVKALNDGGESVHVYAVAVDVTPDPLSAAAVVSAAGESVSALTQTEPTVRAVAAAVADG
ncbi:hypothetical protein MalM25_34250 [Planctomycetes bacterium MalM25]|nr:hypothetical protein MalM25_34250 [Planctomycetes bacterium MalM25]